MYYTPQQLSGGPRYSLKTRVGNWSEDIDSGANSQKDYLDKKNSGKLLINQQQATFAKAFARAPLTYAADGYLRYGDNVMLMCKKTNGTLVIDLGEKIVSVEEAYACTTTKNAIGPCARSVLSVEPTGDAPADGMIRYGDQVRLVSTPQIFHKKMYLFSTQCTPQTFARFSRNQEVCMTTKASYYTAWTFMPPGGMASPLIGTPVQANTELLIEHGATKELLSNDNIPYANQFGSECEVSAKRIAVKNKAQSLANEQIGKKVVDLEQKQVEA